MENSLLIIVLAFGVLLALGGGLFGTFMSIKKTESEREKRFVIKSGLLFWAVSIVFISVLMFVASPYKYLIWVPWGIFFPLWLMFSNKKQARIKSEEREKDETPLQ